MTTAVPTPYKKDRALTTLLVVLPAIVILLRGLLTLHKHPDQHANDVWLYYNYGQQLMHGRVPYRDFPLEYPPLALLAFALPQLVTLGHPLTFGTYVPLYLCLNTVLVVVTGLVLASIIRVRPTESTDRFVMSVWAAGVIITAMILPWRYDIFPALLTLLALRSVTAGRPAGAGAWLALGTAAKLYPVILMPVIALFYLSRNERRALRAFVAAGVGVIVLILAPFAVLAPHDLASFLRYHQLRGLQIETIPAGLILLRDKLTGVTSHLVYNYGAYHLDSPLARPIIKCLPVVFAALYVGILLRCWQSFRAADRGPAEAGDLAFWTVTILLAFMVANKVFSPQYVVWLLPFIPLLRRRDAIFALAPLLATALLYPAFYGSLLGLKLSALLLLNLRNALLVVLFCQLLLSQRPKRQTALQTARPNHQASAAP